MTFRNCEITPALGPGRRLTHWLPDGRPLLLVGLLALGGCASSLTGPEAAAPAAGLAASRPIGGTGSSTAPKPIGGTGSSTRPIGSTGSST